MVLGWCEFGVGVFWGLGWVGWVRAAREALPPAVGSDTALAATENITSALSHSAACPLKRKNASYDASGVLESLDILFPAGFLAHNRAV